MSCLKCNCGCDQFSKDELEALLRSTDRIRDLVNNQTAQDMFRRLIYPDEPDRYVQQPSGSQPRQAVGKRPKPNAIKYLDYIVEAAGMLRRVNDLSDEEVESFANRVKDAKLSEQLEESTSTTRAAALQAIVTAYGIRLIESAEYQKFEKKLVDAYKGKSRIEKE